MYPADHSIVREHSFDQEFGSARPFSRTSFSRILEERRIFVSNQLSEVCRERKHPKILSIANGALREAEAAVELCRAAGGTFVVLDGTGEPPDAFRINYPNPCPRYISYPYGSIPSKDNIGDFDFVYSLNLLNELDQRRARTIVTSMLSLVRPGGRLLLSNFTSELAEFTLAGFHRREEEMADLVPDSGDHQLLGHAIWRDDSRCVLYLDLQKAGSMSGGGAPRPGFLH